MVSEPWTIFDWVFQSKAKEMDPRDLLHPTEAAGKGLTTRPENQTEVQMDHPRLRQQEMKEQRWEGKSQCGSPTTAGGSCCCGTGEAGTRCGVPARQAETSDSLWESADLENVNFWPEGWEDNGKKKDLNGLKTQEKADYNRQLKSEWLWKEKKIRTGRQENTWE